MEHFKLNNLYDILETIKEGFRDIKLGIEEIGIEYALGRFAAEDIAVKEDIPGFNRAVIDGYALISSDTYGAGENVRVIFNQVGQSEIGSECAINLGINECAYVSEGAMIPVNADAVISLDDIEVVGPLEIAVNNSINRWENVIRTGNDLKKNQILFKKGTRIGVNEVGALAGAGINRIKVYKKVRVSVISTGEEIVEASNTVLIPGKVRDINSHTICDALKNFGAVPVNKGIVRDNSRGMEEILEKSLEDSDMVIISGGSSRGTTDKTLDMIKRIERVEVLSDKIAINPGRDSIVAKVSNKAVFGLPGNPLSVLITLNLIVKPVVIALNNSENRCLSLKAKCMGSYESTPGKEEYIIVSLDRGEEEYTAVPILGKTGFITSMLKADGYLKIRASDEGVKEGQNVEVILF